MDWGNLENDVDDRLGDESGHGRRTDVLDTLDSLAAADQASAGSTSTGNDYLG